MTTTFILNAINDLQFEDISFTELTDEENMLIKSVKNKTMCNIFREKSKEMAANELHMNEYIKEELQLYDLATAEASAAGGVGMKFFAISHDFGVRHLLYKTNERLIIVFSSFLYKPLRVRSIDLDQIKSIEQHQYAQQVKVILNTKNNENYEIQISDSEALEVKVFFDEFEVNEAKFDYLENEELRERVSNLIEVNKLYYDTKWKHYEKNKYYKGFNLYGLLLNGYWALYRKMYFEALLIILIPQVLRFYNANLALYSGIIGAIYLGMFGNSIYYHRIIKRANNKKLSNRYKGVHEQLPYILMILLTVLFILLIMLPKLLELI